MDKRYGQLPVDMDHTADSLTAARLHVQSLSDGGREALLRALMEQFEQPSCVPSKCTQSTQTPNHLHPPGQIGTVISAPASAPVPEQIGSPEYIFNGRLSVSTTSSASSAGKHSHPPSNRTTPRSSIGSQPSRPVSRAPSVSAAASKPSTRAYWCTSCGQKLSRKFDWKRHDEEFHERPRKYPCPSCNRVFYGANTFNQHHKSAHGCTSCPHAESVAILPARRKRAWGCGFCAAFLGSLERYHEHVALHYESGKTLAHWHHENIIYGLLHQPVVLEAWRALQERSYGHLPSSERPKLSWAARDTGRAHGFLENEAPGQLQDLLEFFEPGRHNVDYVVQLADQLAIHVVVEVEGGDAGQPRMSMAPSKASMSPPMSKWARVSSAPTGNVARSIAPRASVEAMRHRERPLPRLASQDFQPVMAFQPSSGQDDTMDFIALGSQHNMMAQDSMNMMGDWDSLASTVVDVPNFSVPTHPEWHATRFVPSGGGA